MVERFSLFRGRVVVDISTRDKLWLKEKMKEQALFGSFSDWQYELGPPHIFPMYSVATRDYSLLLAIE